MDEQKMIYAEYQRISTVAAASKPLCGIKVTIPELASIGGMIYWSHNSGAEDEYAYEHCGACNRGSLGGPAEPGVVIAGGNVTVVPEDGIVRNDDGTRYICPVCFDNWWAEGRSWDRGRTTIPEESLLAADARCAASAYSHWQFVLATGEQPILAVYPHGMADASYPAHYFEISPEEAEAIAREIEAWNSGPQEVGVTPTIDRYGKIWERMSAA